VHLVFYLASAAVSQEDYNTCAMYNSLSQDVAFEARQSIAPLYQQSNKTANKEVSEVNEQDSSARLTEDQLQWKIGWKTPATIVAPYLLGNYKDNTSLALANRSLKLF
jgi:hypothetical protein